MNINPALIRTVETVKVITVRDDDKPWRLNSKRTTSSSSSEVRSSAGGKSTRSDDGQKSSSKLDLHNDVMTVRHHSFIHW